MARIHQINISDGGVPKTPIQSGLVTATGIVGDRQSNTKVHGGPTRALCLFALEEIEAFRAEGHNMAPGHTGENVTTEGLDWNLMQPGVRMRLGDEVEVEVTNYAIPCHQQKGWFSDGNFTRLSQKVNPGHSRVYTRILKTGTIREGDPISVLAASPAYERAIPVLRVKDVDAAVEYYTGALGFAEVFRAGEPSEFARVNKDGAFVDFTKHPGAAMELLVSDVDQVAAEISATGARIISGPADTPWGSRTLVVEDLDGNRIVYAAED